MSDVWYVDSSALFDRLRAGLGPNWQPGDSIPPNATRFLDDLISGNERVIINNLILDELGRRAGNDNAALIEWVQNHSGPGQIEIHELPADKFEYYKAMSDGGERSLFEHTAKTDGYDAPTSNQKFVASEDFARKPMFEDAGYQPSNHLPNADTYGGRATTSGTDADFGKGADFVRASRATGLHDNSIFGKPGLEGSRSGEIFRTVPQSKSVWDGLSDFVKNNRWRLAGEAVGTAAVLWDSYETQQEFARALARGDLVGADEIAGGLLGRSFGGAFLAVIGGAAGGALWGGRFGLPGAIVGAVVGGIVGAIGGDRIGRWLFGALGEAGAHISELISGASDFARELLGDPLVLDLDGDGIELTSLASSNVRFDLDGDGLQERVGWVSAQDGLLVHDINGNGIADDVNELFGSANVDGYDELELLDSNGDGKITSLDTEFNNLKVWRDLNQDGASTSDEMFTLAQAGIARFNLAYTQLNSTIGGNIVARKGTYTRVDNVTRDMASVWFGMDESVNRPVIPENADIDEYYPLPNIPAASSMPDLWTAMYFDPVLKAMVESLSASDFDFDSFADFAGLPVTAPFSLVSSAGSGGGGVVIGPARVSEVTSGRFIEILYRWAGVNTSVPADPNHPWHVQVFEAITGVPLELTNDHQRNRIEEMWPQLVGQMGTLFLIQAANKPLTSPIYGLAQAIAGLDPEDPDYTETVATLATAAIAQGSSLTPASDFLAPFRLLSFNPATGEISGDFDAFVHAFSVAEGGLSTGSMSFGTSATSIYGDWSAWYQNQGKFIFDVANAMGFSADYVQRVTGWRWMFGSVGQVEGTSGNDILEQASSPNARVTSLTSNGSISLSTGTLASRDQALYGLAGDDELRGLDGVDRLVGGVGNDLLKGGSGGDMYVYATGDGLDTIIDESGADDVIYFSSELRSQNLQVSRITGTNNLFVHFGDPAHGIVLTNQWNSSSYAIEQFHFVGQDGLDAGDIASRYLSTLVTTGNDVIAGSWASERIASGGGNDTVTSGDGNDILLGGDGDDALSGELGNDSLTGGLGNDTLNGGRGSDNYYYSLGDGEDIINDVGSGDNEALVIDTLFFGSGVTADDLILSNYAGDWNSIRISFVGADGSIKVTNQNSSTGGIESVVFSDQSHWTLAELMARYVSDQQTSGDNLIHGSNFADSIAAGDGNDTVVAGAGNDSISGGRGNDYLQGGAGADTYIYNRGDGSEIVEDTASDNESSIKDTLSFGTGISASDLVFSNVANQWNTIRVALTDQSGSILLRYQNNGDSGVESVNFIDGSSWDLAQIMARYVSDQQTAGSDLIHGSRLADTVQAGAGNDTVITGAGSDVIEGGIGDDRLEGGAGADTYIYNLGDGHDIIVDHVESDGETSVKDKLVFGAGISADNIVFSPAAENRRSLRISFIGAGGSVTIVNQDPGNAGIEMIMFADGTSMDLSQIMARFVSEQQSARPDLINGSIFADTVIAGGGNDVVATGSSNDDITGGTGNDELIGGDGVDAYRYALGDGDDVISDGSTSSGDKLIFAAGINAADVLLDPDPENGSNMRISFVGAYGSILVTNQWSSNQGVERIEFADGTVWIASDIAAQYALGVTRMAGVTSSGTSGADTLTGTTGSDNLVGAAGNDLLAGGAGADYLRGGAGNDTYEFNLGDGHDTLFESESQFTSGGNDTLRFGLGIAVGDLLFSKSTTDFDDLRIRISGTSDAVLIRNQDDSYQSRFYNRIENFVFQSEAPGGGITQTTLSWTDIEAIRIAQSISVGNDIIIGSIAANIIDSGSGDDRVYGWSGNDVLTGGAGNDFLSGGSGSDTYIFNLGDGQDTIFEGESDTTTSLGTETLRFGLGIELEDLIFSKNDANWNDLRISIVGTTDSILIEGQDVSYQSRYYNRIENFVFQREENGSIVETTLSWSDINAARLAQVTTAGNDLIIAGTAAETVDGGAGNDTIYGWSGNDTLAGGAGDDFLSGGSGSDTYHFNLGDGQDTIFENESDTTTNLGTETLRFGLGIALEDLLVSKSDADWNDIRISIAGTSDSILLDEQDVSYQSRYYNRIENFVLQREENGSVVETTITWSALDACRLAQAKTANNDAIVGGTGADMIDGGSGDDRLFAWTGNDTLIGGAGDDYLDGGAGTDTALLSGLSANYSIVVSGGVLSVTDEAPGTDGDDGEDSLVAVEKLRFSDGQEIGIAAPIILDLDGGGVTTLSASISNALYDMDGDGIADNTSWMGSGEGMLFLDRDGDGTLTDAAEFSFVNDIEGAASDLAGLRAFDSNEDGWLSSSDARFADFRIWRDGNGDGVVDHGEVFSLAGMGVQSLNLTGVEVDGKASFGDVVTINMGSFTRTDGSSAGFIDAALTYFSGASQSSAPNAVRQQLRPFSRRQLDVVDWRAPRSGMYRELQADWQFARDPIGRWPQIGDQRMWSGPAMMAIDDLDRFANPPASASSPISNIDRQLAMMVQEMSVFGVQSAGEALGPRQRENVRPFEFFA